MGRPSARCVHVASLALTMETRSLDDAKVDNRHPENDVHLAYVHYVAENLRGVPRGIVVRVRMLFL